MLALPPFLSPSPYRPPVTPVGLLTKGKGGCSWGLKQQGSGGDLLEKFMKGCILDVTLEKGRGRGPACPEKCNHLPPLNEQMFLLCNWDIRDVSSCVCCKAEFKCSVN